METKLLPWAAGLVIIVAYGSFGIEEVSAEVPAVVCTPGTAGVPPACSTGTLCSGLQTTQPVTTSMASGGTCLVEGDWVCEDPPANQSGYWFLDVALASGSDGDVGWGWMQCGTTDPADKCITTGSDDPECILECDVYPSESECLIQTNQYPDGTAYCGVSLTDVSPFTAELTVTCGDPIDPMRSLRITMG